MPESPKSAPQVQEARGAAGVIDVRLPFGPLFFVQQLRGFIRDRCPDPQGALPELELHLADGQALDVCHVVAIAPAWIALAVYECSSAGGRKPMRTEFVPYGLIARVTLAAADRTSGGRLGFDVDCAPAVAVDAGDDGRSAEQALLRACGHSSA